MRSPIIGSKSIAARLSAAIGAAVLSALVFAAPRDLPTSLAVPAIGDHTALSWREGAPYVTNFAPEDAAEARYSPTRRFLRLASGYFTADFDTAAIDLIGFLSSRSPCGETELVGNALAAETLPPAHLQLEIEADGRRYFCVGRRAVALNARGQPEQPLDFPVRLIESGRFFQKFALHDLEWRDADGYRLPVIARLEVSAWSDRLALVLVAKPEEALRRARMAIKLQTTAGPAQTNEDSEAAWPPQSEHRAVLAFDASKPVSSRAAPDGAIVRVESRESDARATVAWDSAEMCHTITLQTRPWPKPREGIYPESLLDTLESWDVTVENRSVAPLKVALNFDYTPVKSIWSYVPMLLDGRDVPTGIPVQVSKNWHRAKPGVDLPYAGAWMHGRTWLNLPAQSRVVLRYATTFARWGGVPSASLAQLSLIGWGHNGFWDQFALGGFGESICFQPLRVQRRALFTDLRPLFQRGFARGEQWGWTSNVGGADTMVRLDPQGHYVAGKRNVTRYASHGPNLAHLLYDELSVDGAVRSSTEVFLPRTDDVLRVYVRVGCEVLHRVEFSRLALLQLGADYYNEADSPLIAWGNAQGLEQEHQLEPKSGARLLPPWSASGEQPWLSLHGNRRADLDRAGQAARAVIVREWQAVLGGKPVTTPFFAAVGSRSTRPRLGAEIVPPPGVTALEPGDRVDMLVELMALPLAAERYYGTDAGFAQALRSGANTWRMVQREAAGNRPAVWLPDGSESRRWPLIVTPGPAREAAITLHGGLGWVPLCFTGLDGPEAIELWGVTPSGTERVTQGVPGRAFWQADYDATGRHWTLIYNLPAPSDRMTYLVRRKSDAVDSREPLPAPNAKR